MPDTLFEPALASIFSGCDLLYHEATYGHKELGRAVSTFHSTARQAAELALLAGAKKGIGTIRKSSGFIQQVFPAADFFPKKKAPGRNPVFHGK